MNEVILKTHWTQRQPWRGLVVLTITLGLAFLITSIFDIKTYNGMFAFTVMSLVPMMVVIALVWGGQYPPTENMPQPWKGIAFILLTLMVGVIYEFVLLNFRAAGILQPFIVTVLVLSIVLIFLYVIVWGSYPWHNMSAPAKGFFTLITTCVLGGWVVSYLFNFDFLSYPTGQIPSPIGPAPLYAPGGPFYALSHLAPHGPVPWESGICYSILSMVPVFILVLLHMWPFSKSAALMKQPVMGIVVTAVCCTIGYVEYVVGVTRMHIEPMKFMVFAISYIFGTLLFLNCFQEWPGRLIRGAAGGFVNAVLSVPVGIGAYYLISAFCTWHFGAKAMVYPDNMSAIAGVMLGVTFPLWVVYIVFLDCWPLPPASSPAGPSEK
jgi:hypothetical protein